MFRSLSVALIACFLLLGALPADAGIDARMLRYPAVSENQITFVHAGDIWVVRKQGGLAHRLSTPAGEESFPRFSPDGKRIAFSGNYDGNTDIYVVPSDGGIPVRVTHHPMDDRMLGWYPDGQSILFASSMASGRQRFNQLYRVGKDGGLPERLPVPYGEFGTISPDGKQLAYMPASRDFRTWKRYRGGNVTDIWLFDLERMTSENITASETNDSQPMWHGSTVYFQSDRDENKRANIWAYDTRSGKTRQITSFKKYDVRFPSIGPQELVFENGGRLYLLDLATEKHHEVVVEVVTDRATLKPHAENVSDLITAGDVSPTGKRALITARGEVFSVPAEHGVIRNLTRSSGVAERSAAWSPDGSEIAYWSDRSGEYELTVRPANGSGEEKQLTSMGPGFRYDIYWSPDGRKLAFVDQSMTIRLFDRDTEKLSVVDHGLYMFQGSLSGFQVSWSSDSRWMAYSRELETRFSAVFIYDTSESKLHQVTSGFHQDAGPTFDPDGKYLYFASGRSFSPVYSDLDNSWVYNNTTNLVVVPLRDDVPSPLAAKNDDEKEEDADEADGKDKEKDKEKGEDDDDEDKDGKKAEDEVEPVEIDLDDFERRLIVLPPDPANYTNLVAVSGKLLYLDVPRTGSAEESSAIRYFDLEEREEKTILGASDGFAVSADGNKLLVVNDDKFAIVDAKPEQKMDKLLATGELESVVDPTAEWRQIFDDVWRIERDFFYDPAMHGVDWAEMRKRYGALLQDAVTRWDVDFVIGELIAELNASHTYRDGGDTEQEQRRESGLLGVDFALEQGAYKIDKIIDGAIWDSEVRSPLNQPGLEVGEGDYLLAVNGIPLDPAKDPWAAFEGLADKTVSLTVNGKPEREGSREVLVHTLSSEERLRNLAWIESKRRRVEEAGDGRIGYIYVPDTGRDGQTELVRMFMPQYTTEALIIDERFNSGGQIPDRFIELLNRPLLHYWGVRDGRDWQWPPIAHAGPKVMLINQWSGSGGDAFPYYFKQAGLGPLIGTRTWGGLIGISGSPGLIDGGVATVPTFGSYGMNGEWIVENHGVDPDIEVVDDPALMVDGGDPQLERAIEEALRLLKDAPFKAPRKPKYPDRSGY